MKVVVCAVYRFVKLDGVAGLRAGLLGVMRESGVRGTLLLAGEGINGTIAGSRGGIDRVMAYLRGCPGLEGLGGKESYCEEQPFHRTKVKLKKEIVTMGVSGVDPERVVGTYVKPKDWNALISEPGVTVIDTRNGYEVGIGTFENAVDPGTESFRGFPGYVDERLKPGEHKKVAMFCTGGIRCEKATAYLKGRGFEEVYHLEGGILKYLEEVPEGESLWRGECFVFDGRVSVGHGLKEGGYELCYACRMPISEDDMKHEHYVKGVSCPHCYGKTTAEQRKRFADRQEQVELCEARGEKHIGGWV